MKKLFLVVAVLMVVAIIVVVAACGQPKPADQKFSLGISDNSDENKNGASILTLKFGEGTASADTIVAKKGTPTIDGKDGDAAWGKASQVNLSVPVMKGGGPAMTTVKAA